jgi:hypothetical protein
MTLLTNSGNVPPVLSAMHSCSLVERPIMKRSFFFSSVSTWSGAYGEEGLLHLGAAQEPEHGLHHPKTVVGLKRLSCLGEERWMRSRKVIIGGQS